MKLHILWAILFFLIITVLGIGGYFLFQDNQELRNTLEIQSLEIQTTRENQIQGLQLISETLQEYRSGSEQANQELELLLSRQESQFRSQLQDLERKKDISEEILSSTNEDLANNLEELTDKLFSLETNSKSDIVRKWENITVRLECSYQESGRSFGSGLYFGPTSGVNFGAGNEHTILTNSHVLEEEDTIPTECTVTWNSGVETTLSFQDLEGDTNRASFFDGFDAAFITLSPEEVRESGVDSSVQYNLCSIPPQSGDEILVLGYPRIGSQESITSTEGIISGYDKNFFITSAKISKGNSGGAALSVKNDCYFGIPTLVRADEVESLGRILDISNIFE